MVEETMADKLKQMHLKKYSWGDFGGGFCNGFVCAKA